MLRALSFRHFHSSLMPTTTGFTSDANTVALWRFNGALASAGKKTATTGSTTYDIATESSVASVTGWDGTSDGAYRSTSNTGSQSFKTGSISTAAIASAFSLEFWINFQNNTPSAGPVLLVPRVDGGWSPPYAFYMRWDSGTSVKCEFPNSSDSLVTLINLSGLTNITNNNNWHYVVVTWDGTTGKLYFDGAQVGTDQALSTTMRTYSAPYYFLGYSPSGGGLIADLDEVRISNIARTASEISTYYNGAAARRLLLLGIGT
jgi:hypothetical protein